jgi:hypothetical protein
VEARSKARLLDASRLVVLIDAGYAPHGGRDRLTLELGRTDGHVERIRTRERHEPERVERALAGDEAVRVLEELQARGIWTLRDEPRMVIDGLFAEFACAQSERAHAFMVRGGSQGSAIHGLLKFCLKLAPTRDER